MILSTAYVHDSQWLSKEQSMLGCPSLVHTIDHMSSLVSSVDVMRMAHQLFQTPRHIHHSVDIP